MPLSPLLRVALRRGSMLTHMARVHRYLSLAADEDKIGNVLLRHFDRDPLQRSTMKNNAPDHSSSKKRSLYNNANNSVRKDLEEYFNERVGDSTAESTIELWKLFRDPRFQATFDQISIKRLLSKRLSFLPLETKSEVAAEIFKLQYAQNVYSTHQSYYTVFLLLQQCGLWRELITLLNDLNQLSLKIDLTYSPICKEFYTLAIVACLNGGEKGIARTLLDEFVKEGTAGDYDPVFFCKIMKSAYRNRFYSEVLEVMDLQLALNVLSFDYENKENGKISMTESDIKREARICFSMTVDACNKLGDYDRAIKYIEVVRGLLTGPLDIDEPLYDVIIDTFAKCGAWELCGSFLVNFLKSQVLLEEQQQRHSKRLPNTREYKSYQKIFNSVLRACAEGKRVDVALSFLKCMEQGKYGDFGELKECKVKVLIPKPDKISYSAVLVAYKNAQDLDGGLRFFYESVPSDMRDIVSYNTIMLLAGLHSKFNLVLQLFWEVKHLGIEPNFHTYSEVLNACIKLDEPEALRDGLEAIDSMLDKRENMMRMQHNKSLNPNKQFHNSFTRTPGKVTNSISNSHSQSGGTLFVPLPAKCLDPAIELCHRVGDHTRAFQFDREFQFNYPSEYEKMKQKKMKQMEK